MDVNMPNVAGAEATEAVLAQLSTAIIAITSWTTREVVDRMLIAGALGFLHKDVSPQALIDGVRTVARGEGFVSGAEMSALIRRYVQQTADPAHLEAVRRFETLSERERAVAQRVAAGETNPEIAAHMHLSTATVKTHLEQVFLKLGQRDRVGVAVTAERAGFGPA
jgi:DNA-binding NarL/FixJ family response regulator